MRYLKHVWQRKPALLAWDIPSDEDEEMMVEDETSHLSNVYEARPGQPPQNKIQPEQIYTRLAPSWTEDDHQDQNQYPADSLSYEEEQLQEDLEEEFSEPILGEEEIDTEYAEPSPFNFRNEPSTSLQGWAAMMEAPSAHNGWAQDEYEDDEELTAEQYVIHEPSRTIHEETVADYTVDEADSESEINFFSSDLVNDDLADDEDEYEEIDDLFLPSAERLSKADRRSRPSSLQKKRQLSKSKMAKPKPKPTPAADTPKQENEEPFDPWQDEDESQEEETNFERPKPLANRPKPIVKRRLGKPSNGFVPKKED